MCLIINKIRAFLLFVLDFFQHLIQSLIVCVWGGRGCREGSQSEPIVTAIWKFNWQTPPKCFET